MPRNLAARIRARSPTHAFEYCERNSQLRLPFLSKQLKKINVVIRNLSLWFVSYRWIRIHFLCVESQCWMAKARERSEGKSYELNASQIEVFMMDALWRRMKILWKALFAWVFMPRGARRYGDKTGKFSISIASSRTSHKRQFWWRSWIFISGGESWVIYWALRKFL